MGSSYRLALMLAALLAAAALAGAFLAERRGAGGHEPPAGSGAPPLADVPREADRIRIEVLNATRRPGLARSATDRLRDAGFDVVYFGNAPHADSSVVLVRGERPEAARAVAAALGIRRVQIRPDPGLYLDATVILGADWPAGAAAGSNGGWWGRVTGWLRRAR